MIYEQLLALIETNNQPVKNQLVLSFVQNTSNDFDLRWNTYVTAIDFGYFNNPSEYYPEGIDPKLYENWDRHSKLSYDMFTTDDYHDNLTPEQIHNNKEILMQSGYSSWRYNW